MSNFCADNDVDITNLQSIYGGFYANAIPFKCGIKKLYVILIGVQLLIVSLMYLYHYCDVKKKEKLKSIGFLQNQKLMPSMPINDSLTNFDITRATVPMDNSDLAFAPRQT